MKIEINPFLSMEQFNQIYDDLKKYNKLKNPRLDYADVRVVVFDGDEIVGHGELWRINYAISELLHIYVVDKMRGQGWGNKIVEMLMKSCDTPLMIATTMQSNNAMRHILEKHGFRNVEQYTSPISGNEIILYLKKK